MTGNGFAMCKFVAQRPLRDTHGTLRRLCGLRGSSGLEVVGRRRRVTMASWGNSHALTTAGEAPPARGCGPGSRPS
jgi:hypothetical protein